MKEIITLNNGLRIALEKMPLNSVAFGIWVKNGSRYESEQESGISHYIEHLLFKGTKNRTAKEIANEMDKIGGQMNAFTSKEYTCYYAKTLDKHLKKAVDILTDMFFNANFDDEDIKKECNVILEEIAMYEDSPEDLCMEIYHDEVFKNTPLASKILGTKETITTFNSKTFKDYLYKKYTPENVVISIAGNFDQNEVLEIINEYFGDFNTKDKTEVNTKTNFTPSFITKEKDIEQLHLLMGFESFGVGDENSYDVTTLGAILGGGMSSILFQKVREERGLCYSIYTQNLSYKNIGTFTIYSALNKNNVNELYDVVLKEINNLKSNSITNELLSEKKEQINCNYLLSLENSINRMSANGRSVILHDRIRTTEEIIEKIEKVSVESLNNVIDKIFDLDKMSIAMTGNVSGVNLKN